jgi:hypothetical protein
MLIDRQHRTARSINNTDIGEATDLAKRDRLLTRYSERFNLTSSRDSRAKGLRRDDCQTDDKGEERAKAKVQGDSPWVKEILAAGTFRLRPYSFNEPAPEKGLNLKA